MQKKWGYTSAITSLVASLATTATILIGITGAAIALGVVTIIASAATFAIFHDIMVLNARPVRATDTAKSPARKQPESISHAVDHQVITDVDEKANKESATTADALEGSHRDEESGLLSNSFFPVYLEQRITAARRTLRPVSLVIFELDGLDTNDSHSPSDRNFYISAVGDVVKRTLRESDCAFRIDENIFAAVMDDTTESGAVWAAERVRGVLHTGALAGRVTVSAGVACYPSHALEPEALIESANKALGSAKSRGVDQVEIAAEQ